MKRSDDDTRTMDWLIWAADILPSLVVFLFFLWCLCLCHDWGLWWFIVTAMEYVLILTSAADDMPSTQPSFMELRIPRKKRSLDCDAAPELATPKTTAAEAAAANAENISRAAIAIAQIRNLCHEHEVYQRTKKSTGKRTSSLRLPVKNNYIISNNVKDVSVLMRLCSLGRPYDTIFVSNTHVPMSQGKQGDITQQT